MLIRTATPVAGRHLSLSYRHCITITLSCRDTTIGAMPTADPSAAVSGNFEVIQYTNIDIQMPHWSGPDLDYSLNL